MTRRVALLAMDLDGTLVGDARALARLNVELERRRPEVALVYATGRSTSSALALLSEAPLLRPDVLITGLGTAILAGDPWRADLTWQRHLAPGWSAARIDAVAGFFPALRRQPAEAQGPYKLSYWLAPEDAHATLAELERALRVQRVRARLIYSSARDLDAIPCRAGKGPATAWVAGRLAIPQAQVYAFGDSGNDRDLLEAAGRAAIVANAQPELREDPPRGALLCASPHAGGVLEALRDFGVV